MFQVLLFLALPSLLLSQSMHEEDYLNYKTAPSDYQEIGQGEMQEDIRTIPIDIDNVIVGNGIALFLIEGKNPSLKVQAQGNILPLVESKVNGKTLVLSLSASLETDRGIQVFLSAKTITNITAKEGAKLHIPEEVSFQTLDLLLKSGSVGNCTLNLEAFSCIVMGGALLDLSGIAYQKSKIVVKGGSILKGKAFKSYDGEVTVLGASDCSMQINNSLFARVENESQFFLYGRPRLVTEVTKFNGEIRRR